MRLIDIHCHLIPEVDDGAESLEETKVLLEKMRDEGVQAVIATPHYRPDMFETPPEQIRKYYRVVRKAAADRDIRLYLGCEFYRGSEIVRQIEERQYSTMAGTRYVLVEFSAIDVFWTVRSHICELVNCGYKPIIAHVERYECCGKKERIKELRELGAFIQVNAASVLGDGGRKAKKYVKMLIEEELVDFIASDAHNRKRRGPNLGKCAAYVERKYGRRYAYRIFVKNPAKILKSRR